MFCPKCGMQNPDVARFCGGCGESFERREMGGASFGPNGAPSDAANGPSMMRSGVQARFRDRPAGHPANSRLDSSRGAGSALGLAGESGSRIGLTNLLIYCVMGAFIVGSLLPWAKIGGAQAYNNVANAYNTYIGGITNTSIRTIDESINLFALISSSTSGRDLEGILWIVGFLIAAVPGVIGAILIARKQFGNAPSESGKTRILPYALVIASSAIALGFTCFAFVGFSHVHMESGIGMYLTLIVSVAGIVISIYAIVLAKKANKQHEQTAGPSAKRARHSRRPRPNALSRDGRARDRSMGMSEPVINDGSGSRLRTEQ